MSVAEPPPAAPQPKLRGCQFSLQSLLLCFPLLAAILVVGVQPVALIAAVLAAVYFLLKRKSASGISQRPLNGNEWPELR